MARIVDEVVMDKVEKMMMMMLLSLSGSVRPGDEPNFWVRLIVLLMLPVDGFVGLIRRPTQHTSLPWSWNDHTAISTLG
jgi:hypothetical protein